MVSPLFYVLENIIWVLSFALSEVIKQLGKPDSLCDVKGKIFPDLACRISSSVLDCLILFPSLVGERCLNQIQGLVSGLPTVGLLIVFSAGVQNPPKAVQLALSPVRLITSPLN